MGTSVYVRCRQNAAFLVYYAFISFYISALTGLHPSSFINHSTTLRTGDEFIVLGCDGIWDCLSNDECVKYVRDRIESKHPLEIGKEMLDEIVSADPRASQGIGGDNMTIMIIDLLPQSRSYSNSSDADVAR